MKTIVTFLFLIITIHFSYSQNIAIPDVNFEKALIDLGYDNGNPDGFVSNAAVDTIQDLNITNKNIGDLSGIEYFSALETLVCAENKLTNLNLSKNTALKILHCNNNNLTDLGVDQNTALQVLACHFNNLNNLDVSQNIDLFFLFSNNNNLTELDLINNINLTQIYLYNNNLTILNVKNGNNSNVTRFEARNNPNLTCIEVDKKAYSTANWTGIDTQTSYSENCCVTTELAYIPDYNFEKTLIDRGYDTGNPDSYVPVAAIDTILSLDISNRNITDLLGIEYFTKLSTLDCSDNNLVSLNLSKNLALSILLCKFNRLTNLTFTENIALTELSCSNNKLTSLNVKNGNNANITYFDAKNNPNLTCIEVDNKAYSKANWSNIDSHSGFSETCGSLGIDDFLEENISIYPNPTNAKVIINLNNQIEIKTVKTFNVLGGQLQKSASNSVDLSNFNPGLYFLKMETNKGNLTKIVIKF